MKLSARLGLFCILFAMGVLGSYSTGAAAEKPRFGAGVRPIGLGIDPDQYTFGAQFIVGRIKMLQFCPSVDFGFGDGQKLTTVNLDLLFDLFSPPDVSARFYVGAGQGINTISPDNGGTDTEIGLNLVAGIKLPFGSKNYYNVESRFGVGDVPDFKLLLGVMFGFGPVY